MRRSSRTFRIWLKRTWWRSWRKRLQRITEAVIKIGPERMAAVSPSLPVDAVRGLGNVLRHDYDRVDLRTIYVTVTDSLPRLRVDCAAALQ